MCNNVQSEQHLAVRSAKREAAFQVSLTLYKMRLWPNFPKIISVQHPKEAQLYNSDLPLHTVSKINWLFS